MKSSLLCMCGERQSVIPLRNGLCNFVSRVGGKERMVSRWAVSFIVVVVVAVELDEGRRVVLHRDRRCRNNMDLLRNVMMSLLTVLGHSLLRCLCVGFE